MKKILIIILGTFIFGFVSFKVFSAKIVKDASNLENTFIEVKTDGNDQNTQNSHQPVGQFSQKRPQQHAAAKAMESFSGCFPEAEISVVNGGQPVYYYMISAE
ncbi:MAG: hypothetical protein IJ937_09030 [Treponema sp.]|nr:hypothetical protein [Treponema sp.]